MSEAETVQVEAQDERDEYTEAIDADIEDAMNDPVITRITRFVPSNEGSEFDLAAFKRQTLVFAPEMREVMQAMFGEPK